jgi:hypothetical protein
VKWHKHFLATEVRSNPAASNRVTSAAA